MAFYGNDFASATLLNNAQQILDGEMVAANTADFFRFAVTHPTNSIYIKYLNVTGNSNTWSRLYDSTEIQIDNYDNNGNSYEYTYHNNLAPGTYYLELFRNSGGDSDYELTFQLIENGQLPVFHTSMHPVDTITDSSPLSVNAPADTIVDHDSVNTAWQITDPTTHLNVHRLEEVHENNFNGFTIPAEYRKPKMIMMGHRQGVSTPLVQGNGQRYKIHGTVKAEGVALVNKLLRLYDRTTGQLIGETRSDALGVYTFPNPLWQSSKYYVIAFDDMDNPDLQAVIHDALIPIAQ